MRRLSKSKKGKANANTSDLTQEGENQDNGSAVPSDEDESGNEKRTSSNKKGKRGRKSEVVEPKAEESFDEENTPLSHKSKTVKKGRKNNKLNGDESGEEMLDAQGETDSDEDSAPLTKKGSKTKKGRKSNKENDHESEKEKLKDEEEEYEVENVVDSRIVRGVKQYRIRWKGFEEDKDTWESEADLSCPELIEKYLSENPDALKSPTKKGGKEGKRKMSSDSVQRKAKQRRAVDPVAEEGGEKVYEVDKVIEVHFKKKGQREFLVRWKGFSAEDDTWEPESNLNCPELIEKLMEKVEKAKELTARELRINPQSTKRFTLNTRESGRRLSSRNQSRQRATYYNTE